MIGSGSPLPIIGAIFGSLSRLCKLPFGRELFHLESWETVYFCYDFQNDPLDELILGTNPIDPAIGLKRTCTRKTVLEVRESAKGVEPIT